MQSPEYAAARAAVIVLDELTRQARGPLEFARIEALEEEAAIVPEYLGLENEHLRKAGRRDAEGHVRYLMRLSRYCP